MKEKTITWFHDAIERMQKTCKHQWLTYPEINPWLPERPPYRLICHCPKCGKQIEYYQKEE